MTESSYDKIAEIADYLKLSISAQPLPSLTDDYIDVLARLGYEVSVTIKGDRAAVAYTSVYPLGMFIRVIIAQIIIMFMI